MARLALRLRELGQGHLHIIHCGSRNQQPFRLGLDRIFDIDANGGSPPDCGPLEQTLVAQSPEERKKTQAKSMLEAHEALCEAAPENILRLKNVLDFLRQELHYETPFEVSYPRIMWPENPCSIHYFTLLSDGDPGQVEPKQ